MRTTSISRFRTAKKKWLKGWFPNKMDTFSAQIIAEKGTLNCGTFLLDDVGMSGRPLTVSIKGVAKPSDQDFSEVEHNQTWEQATLQDIASTIAGRAGVALEYDAKENPTIQFQTQEGKTDQDFLQELAAKHGITMKLYNKKLVRNTKHFKGYSALGCTTWRGRMEMGKEKWYNKNR